RPPRSGRPAARRPGGRFACGTPLASGLGPQTSDLGPRTSDLTSGDDADLSIEPEVGSPRPEAVFFTLAVAAAATAGRAALSRGAGRAGADAAGRRRAAVGRGRAALTG